MNEVASASNPHIVVQDLNVDLGGHRVLDQVSFEAYSGELIGLLGPNGAGKTTLFQTMLQLISPHSGTIRVDGMTRGYRDAIGYVPQRHQFTWDFPISVFDAVVLGRVRKIGWLARAKKKDYQAALEALERTGMLAFKDRPVGALSGGQRQRVLVARALALQPTLLLLDEPFTGLDMPTQELLNGLFVDLAHEGETIMMSTHDIAGALDACSRLILLNRTVIAQGEPHELKDPCIWRSTFGIREGNPLLSLIEHAHHVHHDH